MNINRPARGQRGLLIRGTGDKIWFRQYDPEGDFVDYDITHHDCEIEIIDDSAVLIRNTRGDYLDYADEVLGTNKHK